MDAKTEYAHGWEAGYNGRFTMLIENRTLAEFCRGFAAGRDRSLAEHKETSNATWETPQMRNGADARVLKERNDW